MRKHQLDIVTITFSNLFYKDYHCIEYDGYRQTHTKMCNKYIKFFGRGLWLHVT